MRSDDVIDCDATVSLRHALTSPIACCKSWKLYFEQILFSPRYFSPFSFSFSWVFFLVLFLCFQWTILFSLDNCESTSITATPKNKLHNFGNVELCKQKKTACDQHELLFVVTCKLEAKADIATTKRQKKATETIKTEANKNRKGKKKTNERRNMRLTINVNRTMWTEKKHTQKTLMLEQIWHRRAKSEKSRRERKEYIMF